MVVGLQRDLRLVGRFLALKIPEVELILLRRRKPVAVGDERRARSVSEN